MSNRYLIGWDESYGGYAYIEDTKTGKRLEYHEAVKIMNDNNKLIEGFITKWNGVREMLVGAIKGSGIDLLKIVDYIDKELMKWEQRKEGEAGGI